MLRAIGLAISSLLLCAILGAAGALFIFYHYGRGLPDYTQLADYEPPTVTRVHAGDGRLIAEYAIEKRVFVPVDAMPRRVTNAFIAAEDQNFYLHPGVDVVGVVRAAITNLANIGTGRRPTGGSTITQQVAKNFLLSSEVSLERKIKEAILAFRIERAFTKDRILELYLNEIYLGYGSYGVAAAALNYFNKSLDELTIGETAFLAALPKAPNNYNPETNPVAAKARRDWVIGRMLEEGHITREQADRAWAEPLMVRDREETEFARADYFVEEVRRELIDRYGTDGLYEGGLSVRTTLDPRLQKLADKTLRAGLIAYDRRHGWRGPITHLELEPGDDWQRRIAGVPIPEGMGDWRLALVRKVDKSGAEIGFSDGTTGRIPFAEMRWARTWYKKQHVGPRPKSPGEVAARGDVVAVARVTETGEGETYPDGTYALKQIPDVNGGLVALDPHTGRVLAMSGGYSYARSEFNRVTQAWRQPGSAFKPIVYLTALANGFTPSTLVLDAPFVIDQGPGLGKWKPANYTKKFYGPSPMRIGIEKSRNLMTVRLAQTVGIEKVAEMAERFNVVDDMPHQLAQALGAGETTLLRLTAAYGMIVNGGKKITPTLIDRIQDRHGKTIFRHDDRPCPRCRPETLPLEFDVPQIPDMRRQLVDPATAYQVVSMLRGVVERGTGVRVRAVGKPIAGKTGTTNESEDTWFLGFTPDLVAGVYVGFDEPRTLGPREQGASVAAPIFRDFMMAALEDEPAIPFRVPPGVRLVRVDHDTGLPASPGDKNVILEAFKPGNEPSGRGPVVDGNSVIPARSTPVAEPGGLY